MTVGLYAGSFDPIHLGHLAVIEQATRFCDQLVVAVGLNPAKSAGLFPPDERMRLVQESVNHLSRVRVARFEGLTVDLASADGVDVLIRSGHKERSSEFSMLATNQLVGQIPTLFVPPDPGHRAVSSSLVRQLIADGELRRAQALVPGPVLTALASRSPSIQR